MVSLVVQSAELKSFHASSSRCEGVPSSFIDKKTSFSRCFLMFLCSKGCYRGLILNSSTAPVHVASSGTLLRAGGTRGKTLLLISPLKRKPQFMLVDKVKNTPALSQSGDYISSMAGSCSSQRFPLQKRSRGGTPRSSFVFLNNASAACFEWGAVVAFLPLLKSSVWSQQRDVLKIRAFCDSWCALYW